MNKTINSPEEMLDIMSNVTLHKAETPFKKAILSGFLSGIFIALGGFASAVASHSVESYSIAKFLSGAIFPVGLIIIVLCGIQLFTSNTLSLVCVAKKDLSIKDMLKNWCIIYFSNFLGCLLISFLIYKSGLLDTNHGKLAYYVLKTAGHKTDLTFTQAFTSGILCNIMVCIAVWISAASKDVVGKIFAIWFPICAFIISGFEHSVANMYYLSLGLFTKADSSLVALSTIPEKLISNLNITNVVKNLIPVTLGNIVGGGVFVGILFLILFSTSKEEKSTSTH